MRFVEELKRRKVFRAGIAYLIASWIIIQLSDIMLFNFSAPAWVFKTIATVLMMGFPIVLILAWAFELSSKGIQRETDIKSVSPARQMLRKMIAVTLVLTSVFAVYLVWDKFDYSRHDTAPLEKSVVSDPAQPESNEISPDTREAVEPSVAVIPFVNRSASEENAYFADGIHDDLLTYLSDNESIRVISRTSVMRYRDTEKPITQIARELVVDAILEGGVQRSGNQVHITVQLIDGQTDEHLWAEIYDRELTAENVFKLQTEIAQSIAAALHGELSDVTTADIRPPTVSLEAYDRYLKAKEILRGPSGDLDAYRQAQAMLAEAVADDPEYLQAWLALAEAHELSFWFGDSNLDMHREQARQAIDQASSLAPEDPRILAARGMHEYRIERDFQTALDYTSMALEETPRNSQLHMNSGLIKRRLQLWDEALDDFQESLDRDPANMITLVAYAKTLELSGRSQAAINYLQESIDRFGEDEELKVMLAAAELSHRGNFEPGLALQNNPEVSNTVQFREAVTRSMLAAGKYEQLIDFLDVQDLASSPRLDFFRQSQNLRVRVLLGRTEGVEEDAKHLLQQIVAWAVENEDTAETVRGVMAIVAALAGDAELVHDIRARTREDVEDETDVITNNMQLLNMAVALALLGDTQKAWTEIYLLLDQPSGVTAWDLKLRPEFRQWFQGTPQYDQIVGSLN